MRARAFASALFLFSLLLAGCKEAILAEPPPTVAPVSIPESSLGFDPLMATLVGFSPKTLLLASPDPVYYGSGYLPSADYWRMGAIFGVIFIGAYLLIGVPWFAFLY